MFQWVMLFVLLFVCKREGYSMFGVNTKKIIVEINVMGNLDPKEDERVCTAVGKAISATAESKDFRSVSVGVVDGDSDDIKDSYCYYWECK